VFRFLRHRGTYVNAKRAMVAQLALPVPANFLRFLQEIATFLSPTCQPKPLKHSLHGRTSDLSGVAISTQSTTFKISQFFIFCSPTPRPPSPVTTPSSLSLLPALCRLLLLRFSCRDARQLSSMAVSDRARIS
jgi:hypothetical protein